VDAARPPVIPLSIRLRILPSGKTIVRALAQEVGDEERVAAAGRSCHPCSRVFDLMWIHDGTFQARNYGRDTRALKDGREWLEEMRC
jgi:hypothetical protein